MTAFRNGLLIALLTILLCGCSGANDPSSPRLESENDPVADMTSGAQTTEIVQNDHYLWSYHLVYVNPEKNEFEIVPVRLVADHWNILNWLEQWPCTDCFKMTNIEPSGNGTLLVDIEITHPFDTANLTGFDVRGIAIFNGSHEFPESGLTISDRTLGDGELVNADGYTSLYNPTTEGSGPGGLQGYIKGKYATAQTPDALLNGYKRHISDDPANTRNAFYADDSITVTYEIDMPDGAFVFGYAVDSNWAPPINKPVDDPMTDFGPDANCPEPWKIEVTETPISGGLTDIGGQTILTIDVYDWQGKSYSLPLAECPELFNGTVEAIWEEDDFGYSRYTAIVENENLASGGSYLCLISVEDDENDPLSKPWLDLTAYQLHIFDVSGVQDPVAIADADPNPQNAGEQVHFFDDGSHDPDGGDIVTFEWDWNNDGTWLDEGPDTYHTWEDPGTYYVNFRVTDDESQVDELDEPLEIIIEGTELNLVDVTPPGLNGYPRDICVDGDYAYVAVSTDLKIFDITDPENPVCINSVETGLSARSMAVSNGYAYVADYYSSTLYIIDVDPPQTAYIVNTVVFTNRIQYVDAADGYAYVLDDQGFMDEGDFYVVDVDPPESAEIIKTVDTPDDPKGLKVLDGYAYALTYDNEMAVISVKLHIIDISTPGSASIVNSFKIGTQITTDYGIDVWGGYAYATSEDRLLVCDIDPPLLASVVQTLMIPGEAIDVSVNESTACVGGEEGLHIVDITTPESASLIATLDIPGKIRRVDVSGGYAYSLDSRGLTVIDIDPQESADVNGWVGILYGSFWVSIYNNSACVFSDGILKIVDIETPEDARVVNAVEIPCSQLSDWGDLYARDGYAYIASNGLQIVDIDPAESAHIVQTVNSDRSGCDVCVSDDYAYFTDSTTTSIYFNVVDINPPESANVIYSFDLGYTNKMRYSNGYVYLGIMMPGLMIIDVDPPLSSHYVHNVPTDMIWGLDISGDYLYACADPFSIIDISEPESAYVFNTVPDIYSAFDVVVSGGYAFVVEWSSYLRVIDIDPPGSATVVESFDLSTIQIPWDIDISDGYLYIVVDGGLKIVKIY